MINVINNIKQDESNSTPIESIITYILLFWSIATNDLKKRLISKYANDKNIKKVTNEITKIRKPKPDGHSR